MKKIVVHRTASIEGVSALRDNERYAISDSEDFDVFAKSVYNRLGMKYLKFFKMDHLCKQGILATELLLQDVESGDRPEPSRTGIVIAGRYSSLETDQRFYSTYARGSDGIASPGLFVYTLPNILIGELCIRHRITGEHACFVTHPTQLECLYLYARNLFMQGRVDACLIGWNDFYGSDNLCRMAWISTSDNDSLNQKFDLDWCNQLPKPSI